MPGSLAQKKKWAAWFRRASSIVLTINTSIVPCGADDTESADDVSGMLVTENHPADQIEWSGVAQGGLPAVNRDQKISFNSNRTAGIGLI